MKANGGGTVDASEGPCATSIRPAARPTVAARQLPDDAEQRDNTCVAGYFGGNAYFGRDLNGDGDTLDTVTSSRRARRTPTATA